MAPYFINYLSACKKVMFVLFLQLGRCRPVSDFEKLNRIGEGTYGIVCEFIFSDVNTKAER